LHVALQGAHRKKHFGLGAHRAATHRKRQVNLGSLVEVNRQFEQPSGDRKLMKFGWNASKILQLNEDGNSSAQIDAGRAWGWP
jgi:hypothetical protein